MTLEFKWLIMDSFNEDSQAIHPARHYVAEERFLFLLPGQTQAAFKDEAEIGPAAGFLLEH